MPLDPARWADRPAAERHWADASALDDVTLNELLEVSEGDVIAYAPALDDGAPIPVRYKLASIYQAREIRAAALRDGDVIGVGDYAIRSRPLTAAIKQMLRPQSRVPVTG